MGFRVFVGRDVDGADDVAQRFARRGAHSAAYCLDDINGAFAGFQKGHGVERGRVGAFAENADIDDAVGAGVRRGCRRQLAFGVVPGGDIAGGVQVFQPIRRGGLPVPVEAHPFLQPLPDGGRLEVVRHIFGLVHGIHKGDAGFDGHIAVFRVPGGAAHSQGEGQAAQVVVGSQSAAAFAFGVGGQAVGGGVGGRVVDAEGDDAVVGQPAVVHSLQVALAVQFHAEDGFVVHSADDPVAGLVPVHLVGVVDAGRGGLIDAVDGREGVVVVAQGEVAEALFRFGAAAEAGGAVGLVGDEDLCGGAGLPERGGDAVSALVGAEDDADGAAGVLPLLDPVGDFGRVGGDPAFYFGGADIAVVQGGVGGGVAGAFLFGVVAGGFVGADGQGADGAGGVLQVLAPDLRHQRNGRAKHNGQLAVRRQLLYDAEGDAGFAGAAGQDDFAPRLAHRQPAAVGLFMFPQDADALGDGLVLHTGAGLPGGGGRVGLAVGAGFRGRGGVLLGEQVGVDVDQLDGAGAGHLGGPAGVVADAVVAVGDEPAFRPEVAGGGGNELVQFAFVDFVAPAVGVQLAGLALDGDVPVVGTA